MNDRGYYWAHGEPNNYMGTQEDCLMTSKEENGKFHDGSCDMENGVLCQAGMKIISSFSKGRVKVYRVPGTIYRGGKDFFSKKIRGRRLFSTKKGGRRLFTEKK